MRLKSIVVALALVAVLAAPAGAAPHDNTPAPRSDAPAESAPIEAALRGLVQVQSGYSLSCGRTNTGQVRCWGDNDDGELGNGNTSPHDFAVPVRAESGPGNLTGVTQIAVGDDHACALLTNRQVRCWGDNDNGELGNGTAPTHTSRPVAVRNATDTEHLRNVRQISAESDGVCALLTTDQVRCWGDNDYGQLGNGETGDASDSDLPVRVKNVAGTGPLSTVRAIELGYENNCALLDNGQARCWGYNSDGELGNGDTSDTDLPVVVRNAAGTAPLRGIAQISIGGYDACARLTSGQARCGGDNADGELGDGTDDERHLPVVVLNGTGSGPLQRVAQLFAGTYHTCARLTSGQVRCWGEAYYGELGDGTPLEGDGRFLPRVVKINPSTPLTGVRQIHTNTYTTCALLDSGRARCWGYNPYGQVGNGGSTDRNFATPVMV
jgi:alpha-tubulin suppressor-like RCC1 family protein